MSHDTDRLGTRDLASTADPVAGPPVDDERDERSLDSPDAGAVPTDDVSRAPASPQGGTGQDATGTPASDADVPGAAAGGAPSPEGSPGAAPSPEGSLLASDVSARLRRHWEGVQTRFVDAPRDAVEEADELVASVMRLLADGFAEERERLEAQWGSGGDVSTEELRVALQRYRSFFQRLLST